MLKHSKGLAKLFVHYLFFGTSKSIWTSTLYMAINLSVGKPQLWLFSQSTTLPILGHSRRISCYLSKLNNPTGLGKCV